MREVLTNSVAQLYVYRGTGTVAEHSMLCQNSDSAHKARMG